MTDTTAEVAVAVAALAAKRSEIDGATARLAALHDERADLFLELRRLGVKFKDIAEAAGIATERVIMIVGRAGDDPRVDCPDCGKSIRGKGMVQHRGRMHPTV